MDGKKPFILKRKKVPRIKAMQDGVLLEKMRITNEDIVKVIADSALMYVRLAVTVRASYLGAPSTIRTRDFQNALGYEITKMKEVDTALRLLLNMMIDGVG